MRVPPLICPIPKKFSDADQEEGIERPPSPELAPHRDAFEIDRETYPTFFKNPTLSISQEISYSDESGLSDSSLGPEAELISFSSSDEN